MDAGVSRAKQDTDGKTAADSVCNCVSEGHCTDYIIRTNLGKRLKFGFLAVLYQL